MSHLDSPTWLLSSVILLAVCTACSCKRAAPANSPIPAVLPIPEARDEKGWPVYEVQTDHFALALPPNWRSIDMSPEGFESRLQETLNQNPEHAKALGGLRQQAAAGIKFFAFNPATVRSANRTNLNVLHVTLPVEQDLDTAVANTLRKLESVPNVIKPVTHERVE